MSTRDLEAAGRDRLARIVRDRVIERIWSKDHTVWKPDPVEIGNRLGWLSVPEEMREHARPLRAFSERAAADGYTHAVLLGMGGSSLAPGVIRRTLGVAAGALDLTVLDTTHPEAIRRVESSLDLAGTLFIVASKSGTTVETLSHLEYFWAKQGSGRQFVAITDPGTPLEKAARERGFRDVFLNPEDIGGRYSALSFFGLVPAALLGADVDALIDGGVSVADACARASGDNPGAWLGVLIGEAALSGRDKLTLVLPESLASFGAWVEQLIAESTGKEGKGILPVDGEPLGDPKVYGDDRLFVAVGDHQRLREIEEAGHPVVRLPEESLGAAFYRWEFATAVAGHVLGINPFDQPNVAEAKEATAKLLAEGAGPDPTFDDLGSLLASIRPRDYVAFQAYLDPTHEIEHLLREARTAVRDRYGVATTVGFGPRYLHSTGQLHKGGPDTGVFIQVVDASREADAEIPGVRYTFGTLLDAQAAGDLRSLQARGRRVARVTPYHLEEVR